MDCSQKSRILTSLPLCAGYEGLGLGLESALQLVGICDHVQPVSYVEIEAFAVANLVAKIEAGALPWAPIWSDLKTFQYRKFRGLVDILTAGFPCQPFSVAGLNSGTEDPRHLWPYIKEGINLVRPPAVFLENVPGITTTGTFDGYGQSVGELQELYRSSHGDQAAKGFTNKFGVPVLQYVIGDLEKMGFRCAAGCFTAKEVGAPHKRERWFVLAMANTNLNRNEPGARSFRRTARASKSKEWKQDRERMRRQSRYSDKEMGDPGGFRKGRETIPGQSTKPIQTSIGTEQGRDQLDDTNSLGLSERDEAGTGPSSRSGSVDVTLGKGSQGFLEHVENRLQREEQRRSVRSPSLYPAGRGIFQYEWEYPRTISKPQDGPIPLPPLGGPTYGTASHMDTFAQRVDACRLLGNGVVPDTAEVAFINLYNDLTK